MNSEGDSDLKVPLILRNSLSEWNIAKWTLDDWKSFFQTDNELKRHKFRKGHYHCSKEPLWERNCETVELPMTEFFEKCNCDEDERTWLYFDYKHIAEFFETEADKLDFSWKQFGFPEKCARDSTIWIGTRGAHTPCHMDTYGFNLVAQLYGQKRWFLFPPSESDNLKPTRVPYEESSIYSNLNFSCGCADISGIKETRMVVLNPGDVLFVPFHWWHFVENLSTAISVNIWLPTIEDDVSRLEESLVKYFISSVCRSVTSVEDILNPNEDDIPSFQEINNIDELSWCLRHCNLVDKGSSQEYSAGGSAVPIISTNELSGILKSKCSKLNKTPVETNLRKNVINAFCHPDVITAVRMKLQQSYLSQTLSSDQSS